MQLELNNILDRQPDLERLTRAAGLEALRLQGRTAIHNKDDIDIVTEADFQAQRIIEDGIKAIYPDIPFLGEEQEDLSIPGETFVAADPIDGTALYSCGGSDWGTMLSVIFNGKPAAGCIFLPVRNQMISAVKGSGCFLNGQQIFCDQQKTLKRSLVAAEYGYFTPDQSIDRLAELRKHCFSIRNLVTVAGNIVDLLRGICGAFVHLGGGKVWDHAAPVVAAQEAGGLVTGLAGEELSWHQLHLKTVYSHNQAMHREIMKIVGDD